MTSSRSTALLLARGVSLDGATRKLYNISVGELCLTLGEGSGERRVFSATAKQVTANLLGSTGDEGELRELFLCH